MWGSGRSTLRRVAISSSKSMLGHAMGAAGGIETVIFEDLDLELLKTHKQSGSVLNWRDRRSDIYEVRYLKDVSG